MTIAFINEMAAAFYAAAFHWGNLGVLGSRIASDIYRNDSFNFVTSDTYVIAGKVSR